MSDAVELAPGVTARKVKVADLLPDVANARTHPDRNKATIKNSLRRFGAARSIVLDGKQVVRAGNGTLEQALEAGIEEVWVIESDGKQLVAVQRPDWSDAEAMAYALADNRASELAEWDYPVLGEQFRTLEDAGVMLADLGWEVYEAAPLMQATWTPPAVEVGGTDGVRMATAIAVTKEQREVFSRAYAKVKTTTGHEDITEGRALELICADYLAGS